MRISIVRADRIFPNKKEGLNNIYILNKKISEHLPKEDFEWAKILTLSIMVHKDYNQIRKVLSELYLSDLKQNHQFIQSILDSKDYSKDFPLILQEIKDVIAVNRNICSSIINFGFGKFETKQEMEEVEYSINLIGYLLSQDESIILQKAYNVFNEKTNNLQEKEYLIEFLNSQRQEIPNLLSNKYINIVKNFNMKKHSFEVKTIKDYKCDVYVKKLRAQRWK